MLRGGLQALAAALLLVALRSTSRAEMTNNASTHKSEGTVVHTTTPTTVTMPKPTTVSHSGDAASRSAGVKLSSSSSPPATPTSPSKPPTAMENTTQHENLTAKTLHHQPLGSYSRIVGGEEAQIGEFPHQVAWLYLGGLHCGASLISPEWLVTAAHCFPNRNDVKDNTFRAGSLTAVGGGQLRSPVSFHQHPRWSPVTMDWDIGLVKVDPPFQLNEYVQPIHLADTRTELSEDETLTVTGWGLTREQGESFSFGGSYYLQKVNLYPMDHQRCSTAYQDVKILITDHMLCAMARNKDACQGDSGGPLVSMGTGEVSSMRLLGMVSWGSGCARDEYPGVYTDLRNPEYRQYIESVSGVPLTYYWRTDV